VSWNERLLSLGKAWGIILLFAVVIGGLYTGIATPTEVGALGSLIAFAMFVLAVFQGRTKWGALRRVVVESVKMQAMIFAFIVGAGLFSLMITMSGALPKMVNAVSSVDAHPVLIVSILALFYLPLGMFLDPVAMLIVTLPFAYPIVVSGLGFNGLWFGILMVKLIELSMITPPMGIHLYVIKAQFPEYKLGDIIYGCLWFMVMDLITIAILIAWPELTTWLPSRIGV
jgi:TRAP-type C4-dicarboxylate transport system permease large subunit